MANLDNDPSEGGPVSDVDIFTAPLVSKTHRRAALTDMDDIISRITTARNAAYQNGANRFRVQVSPDAAEALKRCWVFKDTPERGIFLARLREIGIPANAVRFINRLERDPENESRGGQMWEAEMTVTYIQIRLPDNFPA